MNVVKQVNFTYVHMCLCTHIRTYAYIQEYNFYRYNRKQFNIRIINNSYIHFNMLIILIVVIKLNLL